MLRLFQINPGVEASTPTKLYRWLYGIIGIIGIICALIVLIFQRKGCNVQAWSPEISPAIAYGLSLSGLLGIANSFMITSRQPGNRIGWLCGATGFVGLVLTAADRYALCGLYGDQPLLGLAYAAWGAYVFSPVVIALVFWQIPFWFPTGQYLSPSWRGFARLSWSLLAICLLSIALSDGEMTNNGINLSYAIANPFGIRGLSSPVLHRFIPPALVTILMIASIGANLSLVLRWQRARGDERQQIKGFALFVGIVVSMFLIIEITGQIIFPQVFETPIYTLAFYFSWIGYPVVIGVTVLKYRLYDVEIVVRKTLLYLGVTALLVVIYLISVTIFQNIFMRLSGEESQAAVIISTLIIAALFNPMRRRLQSAIDRRFYRNKYDAEQALEKFRSGLRAEVNPDDLCSQLIQVVQETVQPAFISVWIRSLPAKERQQQLQDPE